MATVEQRKRAAEKIAVSNRNYKRARERAMVRLAKAHMDEYKELLRQEKARDKENGVAWTSLDGSARGDWHIHTAESAKAGILSTNSGEEARNNGGEK